MTAPTPATPSDFSGIKVEKLLVAGLRGFCAGVVRAIDVVEQALEVCDGPVFVRKEIIHNRYVVDELRDKGARFVEEADEVPDNAWLIFSAHGIAPEVRRLASSKGLKVSIERRSMERLKIASAVSPIG